MVCAVLCFLVASLAVLLSSTAQPGGITPVNAFLAPFLGPWSQTLPPNSHPVSVWSAQYTLFARCLTVVLAFALIGSYLSVSDWLRRASIAIAVPALVIWVLAGLMKVISQLH
jgi:hypothetical protein